MSTPSPDDAKYTPAPSSRSYSLARPLFGAEKVAALLLALDKPVAGRLLKRFDALELRQVTRAASELGSVNPATVEKLIEGTGLIRQAGLKRSLHLLDQHVKALVRLEGAANRERVYKQAQHRLGLFQFAVRRRAADDQIVLTCMAVEQGFAEREQHREHGHAQVRCVAFQVSALLRT